MGRTYTTAVGQAYVALPRHRGRAARRHSVWTVPVPTEVACFVQAWQASWGVGCGELWGHSRPDSRLEPLGLNGHGENLWFGKFVQSAPSSPWHGYPADYRRRAQDRPPTKVLHQWRDLGVLAKHQAAKVASGRPCKL